MAPGRRSAARQASASSPTHGRGRERRARLHDLPRATGPRSTRPTRSSGSTARSSGAPTSSASSPTRPRSPASSAPCCSSRTTSGRCSAARYMTLETIAPLAMISPSCCPPWPHDQSGPTRPEIPAAQLLHHVQGHDRASRPGETCGRVRPFERPSENDDGPDTTDASFWRMVFGAWMLCSRRSRDPGAKRE